MVRGTIPHREAEKRPELTEKRDAASILVEAFDSPEPWAGRLPRRCAPRNDRISWLGGVIANAVKQSLHVLSELIRASYPHSTPSTPVKNIVPLLRALS